MGIHENCEYVREYQAARTRGPARDTHTMALTDAKLRALKPKTKLYRVADGGGLCIEVKPTGARLWRWRYRFNGTANMLGLGSYPERSLQDARADALQLRAVLQAGTDPAEQRRTARVDAVSTASFEAVACEYLAKRCPNLAPATAEKLTTGLQRDVFPWLGARPIADIEPRELLAVVQRVEGRGAIETAHRIKQAIGRVFRYAVATGRAVRDPTADLRGALAPVKVTHRAAIIEPAGLADLLRALHGYSGGFVVASALRLAPLVFVRPGELRRAEWAEFDLDAAEWRIPASKMKMRADHMVPLSSQAVAILRELQPLTAHRSRYVFPSLRSAQRPMSENTVNAALRRLGFTKDQMTGHGFRATASSLLNEQGWSPDVIERQLAHAERNKVRAAYNRAEHLPERRRMMQAWADYLDALREGRGKVVAGNFGRVA